MRKVIESVINSRNYELSDMLKKIDTLWFQGGIDDDARTRLIEMARANANVQSSLNIASKLEELDRRVKMLEQQKVEADLEEPNVEYKEYKSGMWAYAGERYSFEGLIYECTAPEATVCVWTPTEFPAYWQLV